MGIVLNIKTPVCSSLIEIASACLDTDFRKGGRTVKRLGKSILSEIMVSLVVGCQTPLHISEVRIEGIQWIEEIVL